jgi:DNA-binding MarR family transcriptional regulator
MTFAFWLDNSLQQLDSTGLGVNRIIKQTSSDRSYIIKIINILKKAGLVTKPNSRQGRTKEVNLTEVGNRITKLIGNVQTYTQSLQKLDKAVQQQFQSPNTAKNEHEQKTVRLILKNKGWKENEIDQFLDDEYKPPSGISNLLNLSPTIVINIVLYQYLGLLQLFPSFKK